MITYRIQFKKIISELFIPEKQSGKIVLLLPGLPSLPLGKNSLCKFLVKNGFVVFQPFYSGTYDSGGKFSPEQCLKDVKNFIKMAKQSRHTELYFNKEIEVEPGNLFVIGTSFGTSIAALNAQEKKIKKMVLYSPVLTYDDTLIQSLGFAIPFKEKMMSLMHLLKGGYKYTYRIKDFESWETFLTGKSVHDPVESLRMSKMQENILFLHGEKDSTLPPELTKALITKINPQMLKNFVVVPEAGHSLSDFDRADVNQKVLDFLHV